MKSWLAPLRTDERAGLGRAARLGRLPRWRPVLDYLVEAVRAERRDERDDRLELRGVALLGRGPTQLVDAAVEEPEADDLVGVLCVADHVEAHVAGGRIVEVLVG